MEQIEVRILDRNFKLQVPPQERDRLMRAVQLVDRKMREIRDAGRAQGTDRIAVNAALQLVYEFLGREAARDEERRAAAAASAIDLSAAEVTTGATADAGDRADDDAGSKAAEEANAASAPAMTLDSVTAPAPAAASPATARTPATTSQRSTGPSPDVQPAATMAGRAQPAGAMVAARSSNLRAAPPGRTGVVASPSRTDGHRNIATRRDDPKTTAAASTAPVKRDESDQAARIEQLNRELEAEIRRQESLF